MIHLAQYAKIKMRRQKSEQGGSLAIKKNRDIRVQLQERRGNCGRNHIAAAHVCYRLCLAGTVGNQQDAFGAENIPQAHRRILDRATRFLMDAKGQSLLGMVHADVCVFPNAEDLHIQPMAGQRLQKSIVGRAGLGQIVRWLIRQQELIVRDVRVIEQVAVEIISTGGGIVGGKAEFFLEVIKRCLTKADRTAAIAVTSAANMPTGVLPAVSPM